MIEKEKVLQENEPIDNNTVRICTMYVFTSIQIVIAKRRYLHLSRCRRLRHIQMMIQQMMITMSRSAATAAMIIIIGFAFHGCHQ